MNKQLSISKKNNRLTYEPKHECYQTTKQGLSMSPADISRAVSRGVAVSSQLNEELFFDGDDNPTFDVPIERQRGVDVADVWQAQQSARKKILSAAKKDKEMYG